MATTQSPCNALAYHELGNGDVMQDVKHTDLRTDLHQPLTSDSSDRDDDDTVEQHTATSASTYAQHGYESPQRADSEAILHSDSSVEFLGPDNTAIEHPALAPGSLDNPAFHQLQHTGQGSARAAYQYLEFDDDYHDEHENDVNSRCNPFSYPVSGHHHQLGAFQYEQATPSYELSPSRGHANTRNWISSTEVPAEDASHDHQNVPTPSHQVPTFLHDHKPASPAQQESEPYEANLSRAQLENDPGLAVPAKQNLPTPIRSFSSAPSLVKKPMFHTNLLSRPRHPLSAAGMPIVQSTSPVLCNTSASLVCTPELDSNAGKIPSEVEQVIHSVQLMHHNSSAKYNARIVALDNELREAVNARQSLQDQIAICEREKEALTELVEKQRTKLLNFESKASRFKTFVDGLGNDIDNLKEESTAQRRKSERLLGDADEHKTELEQSIQQLTECSEKSIQLRNSAFKACHEANAELTAARVRLVHLEQELNHKSHLLSDEKEFRSQFQGRLDDAKAFRTAVAHENKSNHKAVLDKLQQMHTSAEAVASDRIASNTLEKIVAAVQSVASQQAATTEGVASVKDVVDSIAVGNQNGVADDRCSDESSLKACLDKAMNSLKASMCHQDQLTASKLESHQAIVGLEHKVKYLEVQLQDAHRNASSLNERLLDHEAQASNIVNISRKTLEKAEAEIRAKDTALGLVQTQLAAKIAMVDTMTREREDLDGEVHSLHLRIEQLSPTHVLQNFEQERDVLKKQATEEIERVRREMSKHASELREAEKSKMENDHKKLRSDRDKLVSRVQQVENELAAARHQAEDSRLEHEQHLRAAARQEELENLGLLSRDQRTEIDSLRSSLIELRGTASSTANDAQRYEALKTFCTSQEKKLQELLQEKDALRKQMAEIEVASDEAHSSKKKLQENLSKLHHRLAAAEDGMKQLQDSCKVAMSEDAGRAEQKVEALQQRLNDAHEELREKDVNANIFHAKLQQTWQEEEQQHKDDMAELKQKLVEAESLRNDAVGARNQLVTELAKLNSACKALQSSSCDEISPSIPEQSPSSRRDHVPDAPPISGVLHHKQQHGTAGHDRQLHKSPSKSGSVSGRQTVVAAKAADLEFSIFEDGSDDGHIQMQHDQSSPSMIQGQNDAYVFKRPLPHPNSSLKLVRTASGSQHSSYAASNPRTKQVRTDGFRTPEQQPSASSGMIAAQDLTKISSSSTSSPDFITNTNPSKGLTTYDSLSTAEKRGRLHRSLDELRDEARGAPAKRKADGHVVQGYERERKRVTSSAVGSRTGLRPLAQRTASGQIPPVPAQTTHGRTLADSTAPGRTRGTKKISKNDEMNAYFVRELQER